MPSDYIWPLSKSSISNEMNTSFGPRINTNRWDFHDGIDLPAEKGTKVYAMRGGTVRFADEKDKDGYSSRHIVLEVDDPNDGLMYLVHLHLDSIDEDVTPGANVVQGQQIGTVGDDGATYPHLHIEFLQGTPDPKAQTSRHPLKYLPYSDTVNFGAPVADRFNRLESRMAARLLFGACNKSEGDLLKVEVDLLKGTGVLATRVVDFHDKTTINKKRGNSDTLIFTNDIGVEGYQKSPMNDPERTRTDLRYGILVRNLPNECDTIIARVFDLGGNPVTSAPISVPNQTATDEFVNFEDGAMPPAGWKRVTSTTGSRTTVANDATAAHSGSRGMLCVDDSTTETTTQRAGIEFTLPAGRFEWIAEGWFKPTVTGLAANDSVQLLRFLSGEDLSVAARIICHEGGLLIAGIVAHDLDGDLKVANSSAIISPDVWRRWRLHLLRIGTRESTAVLYLDKDGKMEEQDRLDWDSTASEPTVLRAGIGLSSAGAKATVRADELRVSESPIP
ncbi:MAG: M23 family metallopeptidase [Acidobacteria bacterium]|nr:M23 family metallopeptidase [Acidobacteriota bacterium]